MKNWKDLELAKNQKTVTEDDKAVVRDSQTAYKCIEFLKKEYKGSSYNIVETFIPMDWRDGKTH